MVPHKGKPPKVQVLLTVVNKNELKTALAYVEPVREGEREVIKTVFVDGFPVYIGQLMGRRCALVQTSQGTTERSGADRLVEMVMNRVDPALILSVGVCFGVAHSTVQALDFVLDKDKVNFPKTRLCDVLVNNQIVPYDWSRVNDDATLTLRSKVYDTNAALCRAIDEKVQGWQVDPMIDHRSGRQEARAFVGPFLSGNKLIDNEQEVQKLFEAAYPQHVCIGGDMEVSGIAEMASHFNMPVLVIKGACDFASEKRKEFQVAAARCAWQFVADSLERLLDACTTNSIQMKEAGLKVAPKNLFFLPH